LTKNGRNFTVVPLLGNSMVTTGVSNTGKAMCISP